MRIFIGLEDIASQASDLKKGFSSLGVDSYTAILESYNITASDVDKVIGRNNFLTKLPLRPYRLYSLARYGFRRQKLLREMAKECDVFIFIWQSFYDDVRDLEYLKRLGKKIVVFFMGSEQRWSNAFGQELNMFGIPNPYLRLSTEEFLFKIKALKSTLRYVRNVEKYADVIYSLPNQSQLSLRPYSHFYIPVDTGSIFEKPQQRKIPVIAHAPSNRALKGTDIVLNTLEKLKSEGVKFETCLIEKVAHSEAIKMYTESDIVIDQLFTPSGGKLAREGLAAGKVVLSSLRRDYIDKIPADCPIIDVNPETLYDELKKIILDYPRRVELAKKGRSFVEKYHEVRVLCRDILRKLEKPTSRENFDYYPTFFREKFIPESEKHIKLYNRWTRFVSETDWYKKYVFAGERDGLIF